MNAMNLHRLPADSSVVRLAKMFGDDLRLCEGVQFAGGVGAINTIFRRAAIAGRVEVEGKIEDHFADILNADGDLIATVALDKKSFAKLKDHWMRCRYSPADRSAS